VSGAAEGREGGNRSLSAGAAMALPVPEKLLRSRANVLDDLAEQEGGEVASAMHWNSRATTI